ncbi:peptidylprolyl isomerase [Psychromonas sp. RZ22]|uniref:peptidylprolyl isomerase n=1 Tax=Psychromonas algarum TaxID=2555643 RepID=UPI0010684341|nr:peptidylprolyl isomerase [Psychromonas sp. RZ22]TEW53528.1 peptidylprolyl isomerase [Psychromonas sp. RZ22]
MKIEKNSAVSIHFGVAEVDGNALDSTENGSPLQYIQGSQYLVPGLEKELEGKEVGYKFDVKLEAEDAYGPFQEELVQEVPRSLFEGVDEIEVGMAFQAETEQGPRTVEVTAVTEDSVSIDANHPLAGMALQFVGEVVAIRPATAEEIAHGHIHSAESHTCCGGDSSKHAEGESCCGGAGHEEKKEEKAEGCCDSCH